MAGAIQERTVPGVPRLAIQPQPRPDTSERTPITATVIRPAGPAAGPAGARSRTDPAQSHAT